MPYLPTLLTAGGHTRCGRAALAVAIAVAIAVLGVALAGCSGSEVRGKAAALREVVRVASENGAYNCAPRELAMAESHLAFAEQELAEGSYHLAWPEIEIAEKYAQEALEKSPKEKCAIKPPPPPPPKERGDQDGDGLFDDQDACPTEAEDKDGFRDDDGCPDRDNDEDGVADVDDKCPMIPEDRDGFSDEDGCPDEDNDGDGLVDKVDRCPAEAEDSDGFEDDDGCPESDNDKDGVIDYPQQIDQCPNEPAKTPDGCPPKYQLIVVTDKKIELKQTIHFEFRKATIKADSHQLLLEVVKALGDSPTIDVRIEGHTDSRGAETTNMKLSQARADSVKQFLVVHGIAAERLVAVGYGETIPIADNRTEQGRELNRRVEFIITRR
ncbi:MAG: OmpA family protein [Pseudomonadota bacterium]